MRVSSAFYMFAAMLFACTAASLFYLSTPWGLALSPDSVGYLFGAKGVVDGMGMQHISNHWPPFYPLAVASVSKIFGFDIQTAARVLQSLIVMLIILQLILLQAKAGSSRTLAVLSTLFLVTSSMFTHTIYYAWSEPLFLLMLLADIYILLKFSEGASGNVSLHINCILLAIISGLAFATRYAGITVIMFNILVVVAILRHERLQFVAYIILVYLAALVIITAPWLMYYHLTSESLTRREIHWHPVTVEQLKSGLATIGKTLFPWVRQNSTFAISVGLLSLGGLITYLLFLFNRIKHIKIFNFAFLATTFLFIYIIFLILSISLIDIATPLDDRILFPILILLIPIFCIFIQHKTTRYSFISKLLLSMFLLFGIIKNSIDSLNWVRFNYYNGAGLASKDLRDRALNNYLLSCSSNLIIASNSPWDFELILDRKVHWLPRPSDMTSGKINKFFNEQIASLKNKYDIIVLTNTDVGFYNDIGPSNGYELTYSGKDGTIWIRKELPRSICGLK